MEDEGPSIIGQVVGSDGRELESSNNGENVDDCGTGRMIGAASVLAGPGEGRWGCVNDVEGVGERRIEIGLAGGTGGGMDGAEAAGSGVGWGIDGGAATSGVVGWATEGGGVGNERGARSEIGGGGAADETVVGFALGVVGAGASKVGGPKAGRPKVGGPEIGGSKARTSAEG